MTSLLLCCLCADMPAEFKQPRAARATLRLCFVDPVVMLLPTPSKMPGEFSDYEEAYNYAAMTRRRLIVVVQSGALAIAHAKRSARVAGAVFCVLEKTDPLFPKSGIYDYKVPTDDGPVGAADCPPIDVLQPGPGTDCPSCRRR